MKLSLPRRLAPLVAGVLLAAPVLPVVAGYAYINSIVWPVSSPGNQYCTVTVNPNPASPYSPPGDISTNYFWWFDSLRTGDGSYAPYSDHSTNAHVYPLTITNVSVYVYSTTGNLSWAEVDRTYGTTIYNGP